MNRRSENKEDRKTTDIEEYCQKLIIQIKGIIKEIAVDKFNFDDDKLIK